MKKTVFKIILWLLILAFMVMLAIPIGFALNLSSRLHSEIGSPKKLFSVEVKEFVAIAIDKTPLSGWYLPGKNGKMAVILCHGVGANRKQMTDQARFLNRFGHPVIMFDFRNHGQSGGNITSYGWFEKLDIEAMVNEMRVRVPKSPIVLWGLSMGASSALMAAPEIKDLAGVIAESPFDTMENTFTHHGKLYFGFPKYPFIPMILTMIGWMGGFDTDLVSPIAAVMRSRHVPMLFVVSVDDKRMTPKLVKSIADAHRGQHTFFVGKGSHSIIYQASKVNYQKQVFKFLALAKQFSHIEN